MLWKSGSHSKEDLVIVAGRPFDKNQEQIELLELEKSDIHVAKYLTILPPKEEFEKRLHKAIQNAKQKYQSRV